MTRSWIEISTVIWIQFESKIADEPRQVALHYANINKDGRGCTGSNFRSSVYYF